jgi:hypothetical protein
MLAVIRDEVSEQDWREIVRVAVSYAKAGDKDARRWLSPWVVGAEPKEVTVRGDGAAPMRVIVEYADSNTQTAEPT